MNRKERRAAARLRDVRKTRSSPIHLLASTALAHYRAGRQADAERACRQILAVDPTHAGALHLLGLIGYEKGQLEDAVKLFNEVIAVRPDLAEARYNLGNALRAQGKLNDATASYRLAISIQSNFAEAHNNLANVLRSQGKLDEAAQSIERSLIITPNSVESHNNLGNVLRDQSKLSDAIKSYQRAIAVRPDVAEIHNNLGLTLQLQGRIDQAEASYRRALSLNQRYTEACSNLALCLNYSDKVTADEIFAAHLDWNDRFSSSAPRLNRYANTPEPGRRLRIGYVSPDFRQHPVAYFIEPLLREHDRQAVDVYGYAEITRPDTVTARLQAFCDRWLVTPQMPEDQLAERIRRDKIDILVDLAGHTSGNRLGVFTRRPAPVQVTWLGYPNTTGLDAMDYRLVDAVTDPVGEADFWASETLVRLEGGFLCYTPGKDFPEPTAPPSIAAGGVTFASFNNPAKLSDATLDTWAILLRRLPQARLLLKGKPFVDTATRALLLSRLLERGVSPERVELIGWQANRTAHLALYNKTDVALDPFPYNGTTTTCEALWMGVPVVTLRGDRHASRVGASLLTQVGLTNWIAASTEDYLQIAAALASDRAHLTELRRALRSRVAESPLCNSPAFARKIEAAYRTMWQHWCDTN